MEAANESRLSPNQRLALRGYSTRPAAGLYRKAVLRGDEVLYVGTAWEVTLWLNAGEPCAAAELLAGEVA